jgi:chromate reductase
MITIISATNRPNSNTLVLSKYYQKRLMQKGALANLLSLTDLPENIISSDLYGKRSAEFQTLQDIVTATQKFIFVIPEYNGSFPGVLKVFMDACAWPDSFYEKKAALVGHSSGKYGNIRGVDHFTGVCNYMHLHVLPLRIHIPNIRKEMNQENDLFETDTLKYTDEQIDKFLKF